MIERSPPGTLRTFEVLLIEDSDSDVLITQKSFQQSRLPVNLHVAKDGVPWWLNEGLAEALTVDLTARERTFLREAKRNGALYDLQQLTDGQLDKLKTEELFLAYKQSQATVAYLKQRFGTRRLSQLLAAIGRGEEVEVAMRRTLRCSYSTLQLAVAEFVEKG